MSTRQPNRQRRILVIEDNVDGRESLRMYLSILGNQVEVAADGVEGVRKALESPPDVAIVDIGLPRLNGYQVARLLRDALGRDITLIAYTAYAEDREALQGNNASFDAWLLKPSELEKLLRRLEQVH